MTLLDTVRAAFGYAPPRALEVAPVAVEVADLPHREARPVAERRADSFVNSMTGVGTTGDRVQYGVADTKRKARTEKEHRALHRFNGYARRIVDLPAQEATRKGWKVDDGTPDVNPFRDDDRRLDTFAKFGEALRTAREFGGAVILLVTDDVQVGDFRALERPLTLGAQVKALQVFEPYSEAMVVEWDGDPYSSTYREPMIWQITPLTPAAGMVVGARVHASRTIYIDGAAVDRLTRLNNSGFGDSVLEACYDAIRNKTQHDQGGAILSSELHVNVLKLSNLANLSVSDQADLLQTRLRAMAQSVSILNTILVGKDEDYSTRAANVSGFADLNEASKEALSACSSIPMTILFGEAPGGLGDGGITGREAWSKVIASEQNAKLRRPLTRFYSVLYAAKGGAPSSWDVVFEPLDEPSAKERAEVEEINARTDDLRIAGQVLTPEHVAASRYGKQGYGAILPVNDPAEASNPATDAAAESVIALLAAEANAADGARRKVSTAPDATNAALDTSAP